VAAVFENIQQYLAFLFEVKKSSSLIGGDDGGHIDELKGHVEGILVEILLSQMPTSSPIRCVLIHNDLNNINILVDKGSRITGVIDWEYQVLQPDVVAADYAQWLSYDACCDPRFADPKQTF